MTIVSDTNQTITVAGSEFHLGWLRFSCLCTECRHPDSFQKVAELSGREFPVALSVDLRPEDGLLEVVWREEPVHHSVYPLDWLRAHGWQAPDESRRDEVVRWDASTIRDRARWHDIRACGGATGPWMEDLLTNGFALFENTTPAELERLLSEFEPVQYTEYGRYATVKAVPGSEDLSETAFALTPHTDYPYKQIGHVIQFCYFAENEATGGEFFLVDGFQVAEDFRADHGDLFDLLTRTPVEFEQLYTTWRYLYRVRRPIIQLDGAGNVEAVYFGHSHCWTWRVPPERSAAFYAAYHTFLTYLSDERYRWQRRFLAGECAAFRNSRILHGRNAFDPNTGTRHLITTYLPWEQLEARIRFEREAATYTLR